MYDHERPHEALGQKRTATIYRPSPRPYPESLPPIEYAGHLETRKIGHIGMMLWKNGRIFTSKTLAGEWVGLEEVDDGIWSLFSCIGPGRRVLIDHLRDRTPLRAATESTVRLELGLTLRESEESGR